MDAVGFVPPQGVARTADGHRGRAVARDESDHLLHPSASPPGQGLRVVSQPSILDGSRPSKRYTRGSIMQVIDRAARREESIC